jgi:hypothetical protein
MRYGLLSLALAISVGLYQGWFAGAYEKMTSAALTEDARTAIEVRCRVEGRRAARECRATLAKLYQSGALDPDRTLRTWCDSFKTSHWIGSRTRPPELCVRRYGPWGSGRGSPATLSLADDDTSVPSTRRSGDSRQTSRP